MRARPLLLTATLGALALPSSAPAFTNSSVTAPADGSFFVVPGANITVEGTVTNPQGGDKGDVVCYQGNTRTRYLASEVNVASGTFSVGVPRDFFRPGTCEVLLVPLGTDFESDDLSPYSGPFVTSEEREVFKTDPGDASANVLVDYFFSREQPRASVDYDSINGCGLCDHALFDPATRRTSENVWYGAAWLQAQLPSPFDRSSSRVDGRNAWASAGAAELRIDPSDSSVKGADEMTGVPELSLTRTGDVPNQDLAIDESSRLVVCDGPGGWPVTKGNCGNFEDSGVQYARAIRQTQDGAVVYVDDTFSSTDGAAHQLDLDWTYQIRDPNGAPEPSWQFPWTSDEYRPRLTADTIPAPGGPASIFVRTDHAAPDGSFRFAQGVAVVDAPAGTSTFIDETELLMPMQRTVPATGAVRIRHAFMVASSRAPLAEFAAKTEDLFGPPAIAITSPAGDVARTTERELDVRGTASDNKGVASVTVNGAAAALAPDGTWSARVPLEAGENTIRATARDAAGNEASATRSVHLDPPHVCCAPPLVRDTLAPVVSALSMTNRTFAVARGATAISAAAKRGTTVRYRLSEPATVTFAVSRAAKGRRSGGRCRKPSRRLRARPRCTRYVRAGRTLRRTSPAGRSALRFTGRIGRRALRPGRYRMAIVATDAAGNRSRPRRLSFRIVRR
jgi:hypothetical protein